jgi:hypothetical protein
MDDLELKYLDTLEKDTDRERIDPIPRELAPYHEDELYKEELHREHEDIMLGIEMGNLYG